MNKKKRAITEKTCAVAWTKTWSSLHHCTLEYLWLKQKKMSINAMTQPNTTSSTDRDNRCAMYVVNMPMDHLAKNPSNRWMNERRTGAFQNWIDITKFTKMKANNMVFIHVFAS